MDPGLIVSTRSRTGRLLAMAGSLKLEMEVVFPPAARLVLTHSTISASLMGLLEPASFWRTESV